MAAAVVLAADHSDVEYGKNLIGVLDYLSLDKPTQEIYEERKWLIRTHHHWKGELDLGWYLPLGYRAVKDRIEVVCQIEIAESDPKQSLSYCGWASLGTQVVLQRQWDAKGRSQPTRQSRYRLSTSTSTSKSLATAKAA